MKSIFFVVLAASLGSVGSVAAQDAAAGEQVFKQCTSCHAIGPGATNKMGPELNGVVGRVAGSLPDYKYSQGMQQAGEGGLVWTAETLDPFLTSPRDYVKGTKMPFRLADPTARANVIAYLSTIGPDGNPLPAGAAAPANAAAPAGAAAPPANAAAPANGAAPANAAVPANTAAPAATTTPAAPGAATPAAPATTTPAAPATTTPVAPATTTPAAPANTTAPATPAAPAAVAPAAPVAPVAPTAPAASPVTPTAPAPAAPAAN